MILRETINSSPDSIPNHRIILAMIHHGQAKHAGVFDGATHDLVVLNAMPVIGQGNNTGLKKRASWSEFLPAQAFSDSPCAKNIHTSFAGSLFFDPSDRRRAVGCRICIWHDYNRGESASGGGTGSRGDCLLVRLSGLAEVDMAIYKSGRNDQPGRINNLSLRTGTRG